MGLARPEVGPEVGPEVALTTVRGITYNPPTNTVLLTHT